MIKGEGKCQISIVHHYTKYPFLADPGKALQIPLYLIKSLTKFLFFIWLSVAAKPKPGEIMQPIDYVTQLYDILNFNRYQNSISASQLNWKQDNAIKDAEVLK